MRSRFSFGCRFTLVAAAVASLILLPLTQVFADRPSDKDGSVDHGGLQMVDRGEEAPGKVATYSRASYVWPHATGPFYGRAAEIDLGNRRAPGLLVTQVGSFDLTKGQPNFPGALMSRNKLDKLGAQYFIVQLDPGTVKGGSLDQVQGMIEGNGGAVVHQMPVMALIARLTPAAKAEVESAGGVIAVMPYHGAFKLDPAIGRTPLTDPIKAVSEVFEVDVRLFRGEDAGIVAQELVKLGGNVTSVSTDTVRVEIHRSKLHDVAGLEPVFYVHEHVGFLPHAEETTTTVMTGKYNNGAVPYHDAGVDGGGGGIAAGPQVLMILDSGIQLDAGDLSNTAMDAGTASGTHRKVRRYTSTGPNGANYGGLGDTAGCDAPPAGGFTHGHTVAATALGSGSELGFSAEDPNGNFWELDGVAKGAVLVAFDGQPTPAATSCQDPLLNNIFPGDLYDGGATGSLGDSYVNNSARVVNFSWGSPTNTYTTGAMDIDQFLLDKQDSLVFVSAGNAGQDADNDGVPDQGTLASLGAPATTKNGLAIGASRAPVDLADLSLGGDTFEEEERAFFSSTGPAPGNRVAPQLMAPGDEAGGGTMGLSSEFNCRSNDNDQDNPVLCDIVSGKEGTSFASPAAAGAALVVRDYFAQGFYPDGTSSNDGNAGDILSGSKVSGTLVKSVLICSAQYMIGDRPPAFSGSFPGGDNLTALYRFNNEQGYGRVQLDNALPLETWPASATGLVVEDGGLDGTDVPKDIEGLTGAVNILVNEVDTGTINVCNADEELRIVLSWFDVVDAALINDLDLRVVSPSGKVYHGNYFTDDDNRDGVINLVDDAGPPAQKAEDCPSIDGEVGTVSSTQWSLPVCLRNDTPQTISPFDRENPTEAVMLSPDPLDDENPLHSQTETGVWTVQVIGAAGSNSAQRYSVAVCGGVCAQSSVRLDAVDYACNAESIVTVSELPEPPGDADPSESQVSDRTTVQVIAGGMVVDEEKGLVFTQTGTSYAAESLVLTDGTERDPGNGALDVRNGDILQVTYQDVDANGLPDANKVRTSSSTVTCATRLGFGNVVFAQFGEDTTFFVAGGCERNARGNFEFGFPDRYMDAGETISYNFAFASAEPEDLNNVEVGLHCVLADTDSPDGCRPNSSDCTDPNRLNNASCDQIPSATPGLDSKIMTILDSPKQIGFISAGSSLSANFSLQMETAIGGQPEFEMILQVTAPTSGKTAQAIAVSRHTADVDELSFYYSTDFPGGGTEIWDMNDANRGDEIAQDPNTKLGFTLEDYFFETREWDTMGGANAGLQAPWNFELTDGGFRVGLLATSDESTITNTIAQWGEDKNFNNIDDHRCAVDVTVACDKDSDCVSGTCESVEQRDPADTTLDKSWNTRGGCGWQTRAPNTCSGNPTLACFADADCGPFAPCDGAAPESGGIWHTGRIGATTSGLCLVTGATTGQCQSYETVGGSSGLRSWREHLITPIINKINGASHTVNILHWRWNQAVALADSNAAWAWEFDTDLDSLEPVDLFADNTVLNTLFGGFTPFGGGDNNPRLTNGYNLFAPLDATMTDSVNGSDIAGNNRQGKNSCYFEGGNIGTVLCPDCPNDLGDLGWAGPLDNDIDDDSDGTIDEYVTTNGPVRNMDINAVNGPDMRFNTLEDLYGDTGTRFQGSIGIWNFEATAQQDQPAIDYGIGVDDVVVEWREFTLAGDDSNCGLSCTLDTSIACTTDAQCSGNGVCGGECAVLDVVSNNTFEGAFNLTVTVLEKTPPPINDCDTDGIPEGGPVTPKDCDNDGTDDLPVRLVSNAENLGEVFFANSVGGNEFKAFVPVSAGYNSPGVLFVAQLGTDNPVVTATYFDSDTGGGNACLNNADPNAQGRVASTTQLFLDTENITVISTALTDNGDGDAFADSNETIDLQIQIKNKGALALTNLSARLATNDPKIDCILSAFINIGDLGPQETITTTGAFRFHVADLNRSNVCTGDTTQICAVDADCTATTTGTCGLSDLDNFSSEFQVLFSADQFDGTASPQAFILDLDLNSAEQVGTQPSSFFEGFESGTFGKFTTMNLDEGRNSFPGSDGFRCQYSDPDWNQSNSYGAITDCFMGASAAQADAYFWQIHTTGAVDGGKAYGGTRSLYMGIFGPASDEHTTPLSILEGVALIDPVNLGTSAAPEMSFKTQIDLLDSKSVNAPPGDAPARGVVHLQLADPDTGLAVGNWLKLEPYLNVYDQQGVDNYFNCVFDPVDDGNTEDTFFDPTDPNRRLGPSSTCKPSFTWTFLGETFNPFAEGNVGNGEGPGLEGTVGIGTWLEPRFNLERFRGRRIRLRFLNTDLKAGSFETWESIFTFNPSPGDDGWWIDDVEVSNTITLPATITNDNEDNSILDGCGVTCGSITADLEGDPPGVLRAPGRVVTLSGLDSVADRCLNGVLQFRYCIDTNGDKDCRDAGDTLLRDWTDNPDLPVAPRGTTDYGVDVRCTTDTDCIGSTGYTVTVTCPSSGALSFSLVNGAKDADCIPGPINQCLLFEDPDGNPVAETYNYIKGPLFGACSVGANICTSDNNCDTANAGDVCVGGLQGPYTTTGAAASQGPAAEFPITADGLTPGTRNGYYYLFRRPGIIGTNAGTLCNDAGTSWGEGGTPAGAERDTVIP